MFNRKLEPINARLVDRSNALASKRARQGLGLEEYVIAGFLAIVLFGIGLAIAAPQVNSLTTGATPIIGPTTTNGTIVGYVITFFILGVMLALIGGAMYMYKHHG